MMNAKQARRAATKANKNLDKPTTIYGIYNRIQRSANEGFTNLTVNVKGKYARIWEETLKEELGFTAMLFLDGVLFTEKPDPKAVYELEVLW
jgi:hypothetical protein